MRHNAFDRYASAVLLVGGALLVKLILAPVLQDERQPFVLFFGAVAAAAWRGGLGPGLLAATLAGVASHVFFLTAGARPADASMQLGLFLLESVTIAVLASRRRPVGSAPRDVGVYRVKRAGRCPRG